MLLSPPQSSPSISIPLGIFIGLLASFIQSLGLTIQRKSHVINQSLPKHQQRVEHRRPLWLFGFGTFVLSNVIGSVVQLASLPVVILAPLGAVSLLWNAFFARLILGDVFSPWMIIGTILIGGGASLIAVFGVVPESTHSLDDLLELFRRPAFAVYFSLLGIIVFFCLAITHISEYSWVRKTDTLETHCPSPGTAGVCNSEDPSADLTLSNTVSTISNVSTITEATPLLDRKSNQSPSSCPQSPSPDAIDRTRVLLAISYASISGIISGMCLIFAKSGVELFLLTVGGKNQFRRWESWVLVGGLIVFALLQLWYLHKALILANPILVCPSAFCFYNLSSIVNGLVYFNQIQLIKRFHLELVALGVLILLGGVWVVSIHSGGGGVDVGIWNEESEDIIDDSTAIVPSEAEEEVPSSNMTHQTSDSSDPTMRSLSNQTPFGPIPISRHTQSEPLQITLATTSQAPGFGDSHLQRLRAEHRHSIYSTGPLSSPPSFRRTFAQRRPTMTTDTQRSSLSSHRRDGTIPSNVFSPPLNSTVSTLGAGLQIGLSPVSPGFALVPKERKRRISGLGPDVEQRPSSLRSRERRSVSEGAFRGTLEGQRDLSFSDPGISVSGRTEGPPSGISESRPGWQRWMWLRDIFLK